MAECIFCKIKDKQIPTKLLYEDGDVMVFPDIHPIKSVHLLIVPKKHIDDFAGVEDASLFSKLFIVAQKMVAREGLKDKGFRLVINGGGAQIVPHLHIHLMGPVGKTAGL
ncbi:HIT domain-containing protein [Patescibacteria group bacterium]|nr:HIT domain-containing protein [Patescibacteria group bacterium]MBU4098873.1 HIT domain-containing protein [Patescibacteria group bacterium]